MRATELRGAAPPRPIADADGANIRPLTTTPGYDSEATIRKDGRIVFTSVRDGDTVTVEIDNQRRYELTVAVDGMNVDASGPEVCEARKTAIEGKDTTALKIARLQVKRMKRRLRKLREAS